MIFATYRLRQVPSPGLRRGIEERYDKPSANVKTMSVLKVRVRLSNGPIG